METDNKVKLILGLVFGVAMLIVAVIIGFLLVQNVAEIEVSDHAGTQTETYSPSTSLTNTLSPSGEGITSESVEARENSWINFDGVDDYVEIPHHESQLGSNLSNGFTISAWINPRSYGLGDAFGMGRILDKDATDGFIFAVVGTGTTNDNTLYFYINNSGITKAEEDAIILNKWQHVLVTINGSSKVNFYIDGVQSGDENQTASSISAITGTNVMNIGNRRMPKDRTFDGGIDEVRMYNRVLTTDEITEIYNSGRIQNSSLPTDGLILYMPFDEGNGTTAYDKSGLNNHGTLENFN
jgi:uncharacterized protein (UPF0333 family)